jgi:hypothetical protein
MAAGIGGRVVLTGDRDRLGGEGDVEVEEDKVKERERSGSHVQEQ